MNTETLIPLEASFLDYFLGNMNGTEWSFHMFLIFLGALYFVIKRIENRKNKSTKLSFKLWFADTDNILAIPGSLILSYIIVRFYSDYQEAFQNWLPQGIKASPYIASLILGFYLHKISEKIGIWTNKMVKK